ncbi:MAG: lysophospholipase [Cellulosilyticaceae bacterium]
MNLLETYVYGKDDKKIFIRKDIPSQAKVIIVIAHGYMEHSGRYVDFAGKLVQHQMGVCLIDHRGNGRSEGPEGDIEDFFDFVEDMKCIVDYLKPYGKAIVTFGHSMGGLITFLYGMKYPDTITGQIFSAPALGVPTGCKNLPSVFYESMGSLMGDVKIHRGGESIATRNEMYMKAFKKDAETNSYATLRFMDQFLRVGILYAREHVAEYTKSCLFLMGDKDFVIPISRNRDMLKKMVCEDKTIIEYPGCMHDLLHDLDEEVAKITQDILGWLDEHLKNLNNYTH